MARRNRLLLLLLTLGAALLSACMAEIDQTITFLADERWETTVTVDFPAEAAALLGGQLDAELNDLQQEIAGQGGQMTWERRDEETGNFSYLIEAEGQGYDTLDSLEFSDMDVAVEVVDGERQLLFTAAPAVDASSHTLTLIGGEILSSNGVASGGDTVQWINPSQVMEARLTERGAAQSYLGVALMGAGALALLGLLAFFLLRRRGAGRVAAVSDGPIAAYPPAGATWTGPSISPGNYSPTANPPPSPAEPPGLAAIAPGVARYCVNCGATLRPTARFCATCGHKQPD